MQSLFFAFDEWFSFHDVVGSALAYAIAPNLSLIFGAWTFIYFFIVLAFLIYFIRFLRHIPIRTAILYFASGAIFVIGAMGFEFMAHDGLRFISSERNIPLIKYFFGLIEESFEIMGILIFNYATYQYLHSKFQIKAISLPFKWTAYLLLFSIIDIIATIIVSISY